MAGDRERRPAAKKACALRSFFGARRRHPGWARKKMPADVFAPSDEPSSDADDDYDATDSLEYLA